MFSARGVETYPIIVKSKDSISMRTEMQFGTLKLTAIAQNCYLVTDRYV